MTDINEKRESERSEALHTTAKIVSGLLPGGGSVYELFTAIVKPLHEKRREDWVREVTLQLHKLENEGRINMEQLSENEEFITVITKATILAQQTHQEEKIEALRNVVLNFATKNPALNLDYETNDYFLSVLDSMNEIHIVLLKLFGDPQSMLSKQNSSNQHYSSPKKLLYQLQPSFRAKDNLIDIFWKNLFEYGLVEERTLNEISSLESVYKSKLTNLGKKFLEMIESEE